MNEELIIKPGYYWVIFNRINFFNKKINPNLCESNKEMIAYYSAQGDFPWCIFIPNIGWIENKHIKVLSPVKSYEKNSI